VDSDWTSVSELIAHGIANDGATAARKAFLAALIWIWPAVFTTKSGATGALREVPKAAVDEAVRRALRVKFELGLFEHPYADETREAGAMVQPESLALARTAAERSFVLLKNANFPGEAPVLPLSADAKTIALIGPLADDPQDMLGCWSGQGRPADVVTLRSALTQKLGTERVRYAKGTEIIGDRPSK